jgi:uncharacterized membrane protein YfhO
MRSFSSHAIRFSCQAERNALVSIAQSFYPAWRATIDGEPTRVWRANLAFQAVVIPAGGHEVVLSYVDRRFRIGTVLSVLTTAALLLFPWRQPR